MSRIFISYRREDSSNQAHRIYSWLTAKLGPESVFIDLVGIAPGSNFVTSIRREIESATLLLAIIGTKWSGCLDSEGRQRLDDEGDMVRAEILAAFNHGVRIIPVLVNGASMPQPEDFPPPLRPLAKRNAVNIEEASFETNMQTLQSHLERFANVEKRDGYQTEPAPRSGRPMIIKKVCMLGLAGVGKTSLVRRYVMSMFSDSYLTTVGVKIDKKVVKIGERELTLMLWDMAGEEEGAPIRASQIQGASGLILVADGCRAVSLEAAVGMRHRFLDGKAPSILAVNKVDLYDEWQVKLDSLTTFGNSGLTTFTTSAKTGKGVEEMFSHLARKLLEQDDDVDP
jgi:small GTP-binding protein